MKGNQIRLTPIFFLLQLVSPLPMLTNLCENNPTEIMFKIAVKKWLPFELICAV